MNKSVLKQQMFKFSEESLKKYLGNNLVDTLLEWTPDNELLFTKGKLSEMILSINGINILKNSDFRKDLLMTFAEKDILSFKPLHKSFAAVTDLYKLIDLISAFKWADNKVSRQYLVLLNIDEDVFQKL